MHKIMKLVDEPKTRVKFEEDDLEAKMVKIEKKKKFKRTKEQRQKDAEIKALLNNP